MLIFVDETGTDRRNTIRMYGYSMPSGQNISVADVKRNKTFFIVLYKPDAI